MPYLAADMHPSGATLLDNIDHIAKVAGEDHVSIGTDGGVLPLVIDARGARECAQGLRAAQGRRTSPLPAKGRTSFTLVEDYNSIDKLQRLGTDLMKRGWTDRAGREAARRQPDAALRRGVGRLTGPTTRQ